jgi:hypothetical protein
VTAGERPPILNTTPAAFAKFISRGWASAPANRPHFIEIVYRLGEEEYLNNVDLPGISG